MNRGNFIVFEGGDGTGKTTLIEKVKQALVAKALPVFATREPGGSVVATKLRHIVLDPEHTSIDAYTEALLFAAARRQHLLDTVEGKLADGNLVLCDRFVCSSLVYQGYVGEVGVAAVAEINRLAVTGYAPEVTFIIRLDADKAIERIMRDRSEEINRLDLKGIDYHRDVERGYEMLIADDLREPKHNFYVLDGKKTPEELCAEVIKVLDQKGLLPVGDNSITVYTSTEIKNND